MTETKVHISEDLLAFKQVLLDDLVRILEQRQPVTLRRWLKPNEARHLLGISRYKLDVLRERGHLVVKEIGGCHFYDYESVMKFNAEPPREGGPLSTVHGPQLNAGVGPASSAGARFSPRSTVHGPQRNAEGSPRSTVHGPLLNAEGSPRSTVHGPRLKAEDGPGSTGHSPQLYAGSEHEAGGQGQPG